MKGVHAWVGTAGILVGGVVGAGLTLAVFSHRVVIPTEGTAVDYISILPNGDRLIVTNDSLHARTITLARPDNYPVFEINLDDERWVGAAFALNLEDPEVNSVFRVNFRDGRLTTHNLLLAVGDRKYAAGDLNLDFQLDYREIRGSNEGRAERQRIDSSIVPINEYPGDLKNAPPLFGPADVGSLMPMP